MSDTAKAAEGTNSKPEQGETNMVATPAQTTKPRATRKPAAPSKPTKTAQESAAQKPAPAKPLTTVQKFDALKITLLVKENPCVPGTGHFKRFALFKNGMTVGECVKAGGRRGDVRYDVGHQHIKLT